MDLSDKENPGNRDKFSVNCAYSSGERKGSNTPAFTLEFFTITSIILLLNSSLSIRKIEHNAFVSTPLASFGITTKS